GARGATKHIRAACVRGAVGSRRARVEPCALGARGRGLRPPHARTCTSHPARGTSPRAHAPPPPGRRPWPAPPLRPRVRVAAASAVRLTANTRPTEEDMSSTLIRELPAELTRRRHAQVISLLGPATIAAGVVW